MTGIALIIFILIWGSIAVWLGRILSRKVFARFTTNLTTGKPSKWTGLITFLTIAFVFLLPLADEIISYPAYSKMCQGTGQYEFAPGMDDKKVYRREYQIDLEEKRVQIFPVHKELSLQEAPSSGVIVEISKRKIVDTKTRELLLLGTNIKPVHSFFAMPWDGSRIPWLLRSCYSSEELIYKLQLKRTIS